MQKSKLVGALIPSLPGLQEIANNIRDKYHIPPVNPGEDGITKIILADQEIDWDSVQKDINSQIRNNADLLPSDLRQFLPLKGQVNWPDEPDIYEPISDEFRKTVIALYKFYVNTVRSYSLIFGIIDQYYDTLTSIVKEYLITGKGSEVPTDWFGKVTTSSIMGEPVVMAIAGQLTDSRWIAKEFKSEMTRMFGKGRSKIKDEYLNTADLMAMRMSGKSMKDIVDVDMSLHPSNYPFDKTSKSYRASIETRKDMLKKRLKRLKDFILEMSGDKK